MFTVRTINHTQKTSSISQFTFNSKCEATAYAIKLAMKEKTMFWHRGIRANLRNTPTGYKVRNIELQLVEIKKGDTI